MHSFDFRDEISYLGRFPSLLHFLDGVSYNKQINKKLLDEIKYDKNIIDLTIMFNFGYFWTKSNNSLMGRFRQSIILYTTFGSINWSELSIKFSKYSEKDILIFEKNGNTQHKNYVIYTLELTIKLINLNEL